MCIKRHDRHSITAVLRRLHWLPVKWRINYKIVVLVFRALHGLAPAYVSTLITPYEPRGALRSTDSALLCVPRHNLERCGRRSFSCAGPVPWNSLPEDMRLVDSLNSFKSHFKTRYFKLAYNMNKDTTLVSRGLLLELPRDSLKREGTAYLIRMINPLLLERWRKLCQRCGMMSRNHLTDLNALRVGAYAITGPVGTKISQPPTFVFTTTVCIHTNSQLKH